MSAWTGLKEFTMRSTALAAALSATFNFAAIEVRAADNASTTTTATTAISEQATKPDKLIGEIHDNVVDASGSPPIVIDNDELTQQKVVIEEQAPATTENGAKLKVGARFPVVVTSGITSRTAKQGDPVEMRLKYDLKIGDRLVASKGSLVRAHIDYALKARTPLQCTLLSRHRWTMTSGCIGLKFDEIVNEKSEHIPLVATPATEAKFLSNKGEGRELGINHKGQIAGPYSQQVRYEAIRIGINAAMAPAGVFSFGAVPVALGVLGAANPSFAFGKPVGYNVRHRRLKGFAWGALSGVPGSWLIEGSTVKGQEVVINPGDQFLAELKTEFDGQPVPADAITQPGTTSVHGEVVKRKGKNNFKGSAKNNLKASAW